VGKLESTEAMDNFLEFLGRTHPMLVHFPIALLLTGGAIELLRGGKEKPSEAGIACLLLGSLSSLLVVGTGWSHAEYVDLGAPMEDVLFRHRWVGVGVCGVSLVTALMAWRMRRAESSWLGVPFRTGVILCMSLVAYGGHLGGTLVYGEGYLMEVFSRPSRARPSEEAPSTPREEGPEAGRSEGGPTAVDPPQEPETQLGENSTDEPNPDEISDESAPAATVEEVARAVPGPVSYSRDVLPILEARCYKCHGPTGKARGGLRLHDIAALHEGAEELWLIHPGSAEESPLYQLLTLPADDLDIMPASGDPLTAEQIDIIKRWIDEGAQLDGAGPAPARESEPAGERVGKAESLQGNAAPAEEPVEAETPDERDPESSENPAEPATTTVVSLNETQRARRDEALVHLRSLGAHAARVAQNTDEVEVHFGLMGKRVTDGTLASLQGLEPCLVSLDLSRSQLSDAGLGELAAFTHLRRLRLDQTGIGDAGMKELVSLKELAVLNLFGTKVGDEGLRFVSTLPRLERVFVWQSGVTSEGVAALREARPEVQVIGGQELAPVDEGDTDEI